MDKKHGCEARVRTSDRRTWFHPSFCARAGTIEEEGHWYCKVHAPSLAQAKREASRAKWDAAAQAVRDKAHHAVLLTAAKAEVIAAAAMVVANSHTGDYVDLPGLEEKIRYLEELECKKTNVVKPCPNHNTGETK